MSNPIVLTRDKVKREWSDFEPKLVAAILSGGGSAVIIAVVTPIMSKWGIVLTPEVAAQIPLAVAGFVGWLTPSVGTTVTKKIEGNGMQSETHSGNPVTTVTASTPIQKPALVPVPAFVPDSVNTGANSVDQVLADDSSHADPNAPTAIFPNTSARAAAFMEQLNKTGPTGNSNDIFTDNGGH